MNKELNKDGLRTWLEIDTKALSHNFSIFRQLTREKLLMAVVKSNAYGHGLVETAQIFSDLGADWLAVDSVTEAVALRDRGITKPILVLGYTLPVNLAVAVEKNISLTVSTFETLEAVLDKSKEWSNQLNIHIKVDTGMHRQGFLPVELDNLALKLKSLSGVKIEGLYSHLADPSSSINDHLTKKQLTVFADVVGRFKKEGLAPLIHTLSTGGLLAYPDTPGDMVRVGLGLYGLWPSAELCDRLDGEIKLKPALTWKTVVGEIKTVSKGETVGYGFTEALSRETKLAICPVGYWHGYIRSLSSVGQVSVSGQLVKILGRVSMDMIVIDVTDVTEVKVGDEVVLVGSSPNATEVATWAGTINYEIITRINPLSRRFYY